jgi:hypothetical protein
MNKSLKLAMQILLGAFLVTSSSQALAEKLDLSKGTMSLGGAAWVGQQAPNSSFIGGMEHSAEVAFGYFVINRLAVFGSLGWGGKFSFDSILNNVTVGAGVGYAFDINSIVSPYLGATLNLHYASDISWGGSGMTGILIALNQHVAVDLGLRVGYNVTRGSWLNGLGFAGVRGFF